MRDDFDIYRAAKLVIDRHGEDAPIYRPLGVRFSLARAMSRAPLSCVRSLLRWRSCSGRGARGEVLN
jgi:hypothetical protein